jgi:hypothetical protein
MNLAHLKRGLAPSRSARRRAIVVTGYGSGAQIILLCIHRTPYRLTPATAQSGGYRTRRMVLLAAAYRLECSLRQPPWWQVSTRRMRVSVAARHVNGSAVAEFPRSHPAGDRGVHRLVQRLPAAQHARLSQPRRIRRSQQDQEDSLIELSALSVKAGHPRVHLVKITSEVELERDQTLPPGMSDGALPGHRRHRGSHPCTR